MNLWKKYIRWIFFSQNFNWSLRPYRCHYFHEIRKESVLPNAKCSQILKMAKKCTEFCQILQICPISRKFLNRLFFGRLAWNFACAYSWRIRTLLYCQNVIRLCQFFSILQNYRDICSDWQTFAISQKVMDGS